MSFNLMEVFTNNDFKRLQESVTNVVSLAFKTNGKNGTKIVRAVMDDGTTLIKKVTASGALIEEAIKLPKINSVVQRNNVINELSKNKVNQEEIAAMLNISQSTVSNILKKNKK